MVTSLPPGGELAATMQRALLPPRFPVRRDLEVESGISDDPAYISYYDHFWVEMQVFVAVAVRLHHPGFEGAWTASAFRQLLRALLIRPGTLDALFDTLAELAPEVRFDAALARVDVVSGAVATASRGDAAIRQAGRAAAPPMATVAAGDILWVTAGGIGPLAGSTVPIEGLEGLVRPALEGAGAGAGAAVLFKSAAKSSTSVTFVMTNDLSGIPPLLEDINRFFLRQSVREDDIAGLDVALDELLTNAVNYGYKDGNAHEILVSLSVDPGCLTIELRDDGAPFDPLSVPEPDLSVELEDRQIGGLGMHFVRALLDRLAYSRSNGWNVLTLEKQLPVDGRD